MDQDRELLRQFADEGSQAAFAALVRGKINLVYAAALRQTGGDAALAEDVTQAVFLTLAREAARLKRHAVLAGWLFTTTRFVASKAVRTQRRWQRREHEANAMNLTRDDSGASQWDTLRPVVDEALHELGAGDRDALVLRYFEGRSLAEVGAAIGLNENSARMRIDRALEKLRTRLARRGVTSTAAALGVALAAQPVTAAPAGLAALSASTALAAASSATLGTGGGIIFMGTKLKVAAVGVALAVGAGTWWTMQARSDAELAAAADRHARQAAQLAELRRENARLTEEARRATALAKPVENMTAGAPGPERRALENLQLLAALQQKKLMQTGLNVIEMEGRIHPAWAELFGLTPTERATLEQAMVTARQEIGTLELAHATARREPDGKLVITVQPFAEGAAVYDRLMETCAQVLGPERYPAFATLGLKNLEDSLRSLGVGRQTLTLTHNPASADPKRAWVLTSRVDRPDGTAKQGAAYDSRLDRVVAFVMGPLVQLVPPDL